MPALTKRDYAIARMLAEGESKDVVAEGLGWTLPRFSRYLRLHPNLRQLIADITAETCRELVQQVAGAIVRDTPNTVAFLQDVRDGRYDTVQPLVLRNRILAAVKLLERQVPKTVVVAAQPDTPMFSAQETDAIAAVFTEAKLALPETREANP